MLVKYFFENHSMLLVGESTMEKCGSMVRMSMGTSTMVREKNGGMGETQ